VIYAVALLVTAVLLWFITPAQDKKPGQGRKLSEMLAPLKQGRVWRFSLYYVAVFGAYVALSSWMPKYYIDMYGVSTSTAALLTALFIFPASLMRPVGGFLSDRFGARQATIFALLIMLTASGILALPFTINIVLFTILLFTLGVGM